MAKLAPSVLGANFAHLEKDIRMADQVGVDMLHLDIMDGHFVPNISFGPAIVKTVNKITDLFLDVHLMLTEPEKYFDDFIKAGADSITFHFEVHPDPAPLANELKSKGCQAGLSVNPDADVEKILPFLKDFDLFLMMSVFPGFGGQKFIESVLPKIKRVKEYINENNLSTTIQVDGGIDGNNAEKVVSAGADILVMGTAFFGSDNQAALTKKVKALSPGSQMSQSYLYLSSGSIQKEYEEAVKNSSRNQVAERLMAGDAGLFSREAKVKKLVTNRLGWIDIAGKMKRNLPLIEKFGKDVLKSNIKHVVISGMGGSSLCPDLFRLIFDKHPKLYSFDVLDSTDPTAIVNITNKIDLRRTLFIIASKSGSTIETYSHMIYFIDLLEKNKIKNIGDHFAAITDKGSALEKFGRKNKFRKIFINPSDIGGRYSALSYFGLVPGFFAGVDLKVLLNSAISMGKIIKERQGETNPAIVLGSFMASASLKGIDKLTFIASKKIAPLVPWIEQLVAESTGKNGNGVIPIEAEPAGNAAEYSKDRLFLFLRLTKKKTDGLEKLKAQLIHEKFPIVQLNMNSVDDLGAQFILWEAATAIAGYQLKINPFDEPNVSESKANTSAILKAYQESGCFYENPPTASYKNLNLIGHSGKKYSRADVRDVRKVLKQFFASLKKTKYCTILNYFNADNKTEKILSDIREQIRKQKNTATLRGYGPRYLHSVGQLYKGGPAKGCFIIFVRESYTQLEIPGKFYDFGQLISAQAVGDARALASRNLPLLVFSIKGSPSEGLKEFSKLINRALK